jgi:hypothetical protein
MLPRNLLLQAASHYNYKGDKMKFNFKMLISVLAIIIALSSTSCDKFENVFLNLPIKTEITATGNGPDIFERETICLSDYDSFNDNVDDVEAVKYVTSAYFTITSTAGLQGTGIMATLYQGDGVTPLFSITLPSAVASDYIDNPLKIELTPQQIDLLNNYLADYNTNNCFVAELRVANVSANSGPPYSITGQFEMVVELQIKL